MNYRDWLDAEDSETHRNLYYTLEVEAVIERHMVAQPLDTPHIALAQHIH